MIRNLTFSIFLFLFFYSECQQILDITAHGHEQYQDIIVNNQVIKPASGNHKDCHTRYEVIKQFLINYNRSFTMLDLGASQGYYSIRAAYDFTQSVFVMIEGNNQHYPKVGSQLLDICKANNKLNNIIFLNKKICLPDLQKLQKCEHFDIILCLNILHWFPKNWKTVANTILGMGDYVIIETPPIENVVNKQANKTIKDIIDYLKKKGAKILAKVPRHTSNNESSIYLIETKKMFLEQKCWITIPREKKETHKIISSFDEKKLIKEVDWPPKTFIESNWEPGINLVTFKMYHGAYPSKSTIKKSIKKLSTIRTNDWMPNNMIIQGNNLVMIDTNDPTHGPNGPGGGAFFSPQRLNKILKFVDLGKPHEIRNFFWQNLVGINPPK